VKSNDNSSGSNEVVAIPESLADSAGFLFNRTAHILTEMNEKALAPLKLSPRELGLLRILASEGPLSQHAIGKKHNVDRTTIVQIVDALEARDLLNRVTNEADRRSNLLYLTPRGKKTLTQAVKLYERQQEKFLAPLQPEDWAHVKACMTKLINYHLSNRLL
jgi:DNA-binding MarR family transcriptional regulator